MTYNLPGSSPAWKAAEARRRQMAAQGVSEPEPEPEPAKPVVSPLPPVWVSPGQRIMREVAAEHGVEVVDLTSKRRIKHIVEARHHAAYRMATETELSFPQIANIIGYAEHTAVMHAVRRHAKENGLRNPVPFLGPNPSRRGDFWTDEILERAHAYRLEGNTWRDIAEAIGASSATAVESAMARYRNTRGRW